MDSCKNCKNRDEFGFCEKLIIDTRRCLIDDGIRSEHIKAYYLGEREEEDDRSSFIVPADFKCKHHSIK